MTMNAKIRFLIWRIQRPSRKNQGAKYQLDVYQAAGNDMDEEGVAGQDSRSLHNFSWFQYFKWEKTCLKKADTLYDMLQEPGRVS